MKKKIMRFGFALLASIFLATLVALGGGDGGIRFGPISVFSLCAIVAFGINWLAFIPANVAGTERYYDLTGSLTYLSVIIIALMLSGDPGVRAMDCVGDGGYMGIQNWVHSCSCESAAMAGMIDLTRLRPNLRGFSSHGRYRRCGLY